MKQQNKTLKSEVGLVSIVVTMILMLIISLIVIGFAKLVRREQRQSLDRQLSTQAFYAAETGINDASKALQTASAAELNVDYTGNCTSFNIDDYTSIANPNLDGPNVQNTCLLVDPSPTFLEYGNIEIDKSTVIPIISKSGTNISQLALNWQSTTVGAAAMDCPTALGTFPANASWPANCHAGILRVDLVPITAIFNRGSLLSTTLTAFLQPVNGGSGTLAYNTQGATVGANCTDAGTQKKCTVTITGLNNPRYYMRVRSIYKPNSLTVIARDAFGNELELSGAQALIDSTGKAADVLRRVVVGVPIGPSYGGDFPEFALSSRETICKRLTVYPGGTLPASTDQPDPACQP